jgi:hypothetical protein
MPAGQDIINGALTALGILDQGGTPSVSDSTDALTELNNMWQAWGVDEDLVYAIQNQTFAWAPATASNVIGPNATAPFNVPYPQKLYHAHWIDSLGVRSDLEIVEALGYSRHGDLGATAKRPDEIFLDWNVDPVLGGITAALWPVPSLAGTVELDTAVTFQLWTLTGVFILPYGFQDALQYALAWRLLPRFGAAVAQQVAEVVRELGQKSEMRLIAMNAANRQKPLPPPISGGQSPITTPAVSNFQGIQPK